MNIFFVNSDPKVAAFEHNSVHLRKMIVEYAQILSTTHRVLDSKLEISIVNEKQTRIKSHLYLPSDTIQVVGSRLDNQQPVFRITSNIFYSATHKNHPSAVWVRQSAKHYIWLLDCLAWMLFVYYNKYDKEHKTSNILRHLKNIPNGIPDSDFKVPPLACNKLEYSDLHEMLVTGEVDIVEAYQKYLNHKFSTWLSRDKPMKFEWPVYKPKWYQNI